MATSGIYDGSVMRFYVDDGVGGAKTALGYATTMTVSLSAETVQTTHKDNAGSGVWSEEKPKTLSGSISFEAFWSQTTIGTSTKLFWDLFGYFSNRTKLAFAVKTATTGDKQLVGYGYINALDGTATDKEDATFTGTMVTTGAVEEATIT